MKVRIPAFREASVLVIGDVMLDRYWYGRTGRVSQEAPVPVVDVQSTEDRPGGAANVALNIAALGARCTLIGVVGDDDAANVLERRLEAAGVTCALIRLDGWSTITKLRVVSKRQQLLRLDFERPFDSAVQSELERLTERHAASANVVVLEDYDKGTLDAPGALISIAQGAGCRVVVDPKFKPVASYRGADVVKPNGVEFEHATGGFRDFNELITKGAALAQSSDVGALVVTRGADGLTVIERDGAHFHVPARLVDVFDETGAGDTVVALLGAGLAAGLDLNAAATLANLAAGIVVAKSGTATATVPELERALYGDVHGGASTQGDRSLHGDRGIHSDRGILDADELHDAVAAARKQGERIVFTNGCFDILHAGHVAYLEEARALGDRLIVAVNDDDSVTRLKGAGRPVNGLDGRLRVLAGLTSVDWVVSFASDTPEALIERLRPDVLVKGGDYTVDQVVGAELVRRYGGDVKVLGKVDGVSTTSIVERVKRAPS